MFAQTDDEFTTIIDPNADKKLPESLTGTQTRDDQPTKIGKYDVLFWVAKGGFGSVYKGHDPHGDIDVAIKIPRPDRFKSRTQEEEFLREASSIAKLNHPNIVRYFNADTDENGHPYLVMEWIQGEPLSHVLRDKGFTIDESCEFVAQVAEAIHYADQKGYVHRDLKPANIMVDETGRPRVTDFGLALHEDIQHSHKGEISGTMPYMSPEQVLGKSEYLDGRTDVWSLCVIFYEMLAGVRPFKSKGRELPSEIIEREPRPPSHKNPDVPKELDEIVMKGMEKNLSKRTVSGAALADLIGAFLKQQQQLKQTLPMETKPQRTNRKSSVWAVGALSLATALLISLFVASGPAKERVRKAPKYGKWFNLFENEPTEVVYIPPKVSPSIEGFEDSSSFSSETHIHYLCSSNLSVYSYLENIPRFTRGELAIEVHPKRYSEFGVVWQFGLKEDDRQCQVVFDVVSFLSPDNKKYRVQLQRYHRVFPKNEEVLLRELTLPLSTSMDLGVANGEKFEVRLTFESTQLRSLEIDRDTVDLNLFDSDYVNQMSDPVRFPPLELAPFVGVMSARSAAIEYRHPRIMLYTR